MLRPRPFDDVEGSVGIEARLAKRSFACNLSQIAVGSHILEEERLDLLAEVAGAAQKRAPVEFAELQAEADEILEMTDPFRANRSGHDQAAQRVHDDRGVARPMEEIIRVWIIGRDDGGGEHRPSRRLDRLAEA